VNQTKDVAFSQTAGLHKVAVMPFRMHLKSPPHRVEDVSVLRQTEQFVGHRDCVDVGVFAVVKVGVWPPNVLEHFKVETETLDGASEAEPRVAPVLPEVAVHRVFLVRILSTDFI
jgi:hypothetical protein